MDVALCLKSDLFSFVAHYLARGPHHQALCDHFRTNDSFWSRLLESLVGVKVPDNSSGPYSTPLEQYDLLRTFLENPGPFEDLEKNPAARALFLETKRGNEFYREFVDIDSVSTEEFGLLAYLTFYFGATSGFVYLCSLVRIPWWIYKDLVAFQKRLPPDHPYRPNTKTLTIFLDQIVKEAPTEEELHVLCIDFVASVAWKEDDFELVKLFLEHQGIPHHIVLWVILYKNRAPEFVGALFDYLRDRLLSKIIPIILDFPELSEPDLLEDLITRKGYLVPRRSLGFNASYPADFLKIFAKHGKSDLLNFEELFYGALDYPRALYFLKSFLFRDYQGSIDLYYEEKASEIHKRWRELEDPYLGLPWAILFGSLPLETVNSFMSEEAPEKIPLYVLWYFIKYKSDMPKDEVDELLGHFTEEERDIFQELYDGRHEELKIEENVPIRTPKRKFDKIEESVDSKRPRLE